MEKFSEIIAKQKFSEKLSSHREKTDKLIAQELYTEAFLSNYILSEYFAMKLIHSHRAYKDTSSLIEKIEKPLIKNNVDINENNLGKQITNFIFSYIKKKSEERRDYIDVSLVIKALEEMHIEVDRLQLKYLLAYELNKEDKGKLVSTVERKTIRKKRNEVVHQNLEIQDTYFQEVNVFFNYFFGLASSVTPKA